MKKRKPKDKPIKIVVSIRESDLWAERYNREYRLKR